MPAVFEFRQCFDDRPVAKQDILPISYGGGAVEGEGEQEEIDHRIETAGDCEYDQPAG